MMKFLQPRTFISFALTIGFLGLALKGSIDAEYFMMAFMLVIGFFFKQDKEDK